MARRLLIAIAVLIPCAFAPIAAAQICAPFTDVAAASGFCTNIQWMHNRGITLGCTATAYCPNSGVTRASMALFLNRLGSALTADLRHVELVLPAVDPDLANALCATGAIVATPYPRQALVSIAFAGQSAGDLGYAARPLVSTDGGTTWNPVTNPASDVRESVAGAAWTNVATSGVYPIPAAQAVRFAIGVARHSGTADFTQARCQLTANVVNANGASSPFDPAR